MPRGGAAKPDLVNKPMASAEGVTAIVKAEPRRTVAS
jgi:hypothetical protein